MLCILPPRGRSAEAQGSLGRLIGRGQKRGDVSVKIVIFGLSVSSSWGNGHATLWRGLCRSLTARGHHVVFFEKDVPYYAATRDLTELPGGGSLRLYSNFEDVRSEASRLVDGSDLALTTSFCPDGRAASALVCQSRSTIKAFYDLDTPVTLHRLAEGDSVPYLPEAGLGAFDLVLSYTGGRALTELRDRLGARHVAPLYGWVDPEAHHPVSSVPAYRSDLSYLGTYAEDRQAALEELLVAPARLRTDLRFVIGGAQYPESFPWTPNMFFLQHMPPPQHPAFFCSSRLTLNVTRQSMANYGFCPSGRLFEAAACGTALVSDRWEGLEEFFVPGEEILLARTRDEVNAALSLTDRELRRMAQRARDRVLAEHSAGARAQYLEELCQRVLREGRLQTVERAGSLIGPAMPDSCTQMAAR